MLNNKVVSNSINKDVMSPKDAYMKYIQLEAKHKEYGEVIKNTENYLVIKNLRRKRKEVREEQNLLYPFIAEGYLVNELQRKLGLKNQTLYKRYKNSTHYKKERV